MTDSEKEAQKRVLTTQEGLDLFDQNRLGPAFFGLLFVSSIVALAYTLSAFGHDIVLSMVLVAMFRPWYLRLRAWLGGKSWLASGTVTVAVLLLVAVPLSFLASALMQQAGAAYGAFANMLSSSASGGGPTAGVIEEAERLLATVGVRISPEQVNTLLLRFGQVVDEHAVEVGGSVLSNLFAFAVHIAVILVIVFYLLIDADRLQSFIFKLSPLPDEQEEMLVRTFGRVAKGTLIGNGIGSVGQGALCGIAMWAAGLPSALFWGAVMSILAFLPLAGVSIVVIPFGIYLFVTGSSLKAILFLAFCLAQAGIFENVVKTKLIGAGAAMPDLLAFLSILGGLAAFGVLGLLYGPLIATAFLAMVKLYFGHYRRMLALNFVGRQG